MYVRGICGAGRGAQRARYMIAFLLPLLASSTGVNINLPGVHTHCGSLARRLLSYQRIALKPTSTAAEVTTQMQMAFETFRTALPVPSNSFAPRIVDIGCGMGIYHAFISQHYANRSHHFLVDRSNNQIDVPESNDHKKFARKGGFHKNAREVAFYSSEQCARKIATMNGMTSERWQWVNATESNVRALGMASVDVVMSLLSWGFHYPVSTYAAAARAVLKPGTGRLILELRAGQDGEMVLEKQHGFRCSRHAENGEKLPSASSWYTVSCSHS